MTWPVRKIDEVAIFLNSRRVPVKAADRAKRQGPYPYYGASGIVDWVDDYIFDGEYLLISEDGENLRSRNAPIAFLARGKYWVNNHAHILDEREPGVLRYLLWALNRTDLSPYITGAAQPKLNKRTLADVEVAIPPLPERLEINGVLGALDDKIELNRRMSAALEEMARALYRSWFVDFDPVHAHALGQSPAHMDAATAAFFPDSFGPDGLPKGWKREPLAQHVRATRGLSYKGKHLCEAGEGVPLHNLNSIYEGGGYKDEGAKFYDGEFKPRHEIRPGDLIVANTEQSFGLELIGHAALVPSWLGPSGIFSQHLYKVEMTPGSPLSKEWLYLALSIAPLGVEIRGFSNGTTVNMLPADAFEIPEIASPPAALVERMNEFVRPAFAQQERLREEARTLAAIRDTLLPRLMSGELRIREAEKQVEEVI